MKPLEKDLRLRAAQARYRAAWRNLFAGSTVLIVAVAAVVWLAALA